MTWIALADHTGQRFSPSGLGPEENGCRDDFRGSDALLAKGSLMIETRLSPDGKPQDLLTYGGCDGWLRALTLQAIPGGGLTFVVAQNGEVTHATILHKGSARTDVVRIIYSWDAPQRWARFAVEWPDGLNVHMASVPNPKPIPISDLQTLFLEPGKRHMSEDVVFFALSDMVEPLGPTPTLTPGVPVETACGYRRAGDVKRGDLVLTEMANLVPVLYALRRTVPARGSFAPVRLRAPYFGLQQDIVVAPDQRLVIRGSEVEYLFGREAVLVPARHLVNGTAALHEHALDTVSYCQLLLPGHEALIAAGTAAESFYIGRLRRKPDKLGASLLASVDRNALPEQGQAAYPVLKWFDAITLAEQRAA